MAQTPAAKRIMRESREMNEAGPNPDFSARPLEDNIFEWHFTIRGPPGTAFEGGRYHGRITLPPEYPFKPPSILLLNASGRFEVGKKICLSVSDHHPELWQPAWGVRTIIMALIAFFPTKADGAIAGLDYTDAERRKIAAASRNWRCPRCDTTLLEALPDSNAACSRAASDAPAPEAAPASPPVPAPKAAPGAEDSAASTEGGSAAPPEESEPPRTPASPEVAAREAAPPQDATLPPAAAAIAPKKAAARTPAAPPQRDWLGVFAALLVGLIALLVARKLLSHAG
jgi:ubiquitin-conjugating enzyme E2 J1